MNLFQVLVQMCILSIIVKRNLKMTVLRENGVVMKLWHFLRKYILTLKRFDLLLQGSLLITILLESQVFLLLRRDHGGGQTPTIVEDWVMISAAGVEFLVGSVLGWFGRSRRNFALSAWLGVAAATGFLVLFVPFEVERNPHVELCGGESVIFRSSPTESNLTARLVLLIFAAVACCLAKISVWAHGFTYLDDHEPHNGSHFYGILISIRLSLGLSGQNWLQASSLSADWWKAHISLCSLTLMFSILFTLFPTQMKDFHDEEIEKDENHAFLRTVQRVACNKVVVLQTVAISLLSAAVFGFVHYDRAYVQARFHMEAYRQDPRSSRALSDILRSLVIIFFVMIFRIRFSDRRSDGVKASTASRVGGVVAAIVAVLLAVIAALGCDVATVEGVNDGAVQPACSNHCGCDSARYGFTPVCGLDTDTTYFSPCHAGCQEVRDLNGFPLFSNCTCGEQQAVRGACSIVQCRPAFSAYQVIYTVFLAVAASSLLMQGMAVVRAVRRLDKTVAQAGSMAVVALLASVLGHLLYMLISNETCALQSEGRCVLHNQSLWIIACVSSVLALGSAVASALASRMPSQSVIPTTEL